MGAKAKWGKEKEKQGRWWWCYSNEQIDLIVLQEGEYKNDWKLLSALAIHKILKQIVGLHWWNKVSAEEIFKSIYFLVRMMQKVGFVLWRAQVGNDWGNWASWWNLDYHVQMIEFYLVILIWYFKKLFPSMCAWMYFCISLCLYVCIFLHIYLSCSDLNPGSDSELIWKTKNCTQVIAMGLVSDAIPSSWLIGGLMRWYDYSLICRDTSYAIQR